MKKINLAITGCMGRMGQQLIKSANKDKSFKIISLTESRRINKRIFVMDCNDEQEKKEYVIVINPEVTSSSEELNTYKEGCLSIPEITEEVVRPEKVHVSYQDLAGNFKTKKLEGLWATCFQHELDHLNGKLFIDYLRPIKKALIKNKIKKLNKKR